MDDPLFRHLTPAQREAVEHIDGPLLILAGPGSGKTRVVTHRIGNLLRHGIPASRILALTFTNKAAQEMKSRVEGAGPRAFGLDQHVPPFCARLLREYAPMVGLTENFTIYDTSDSQTALKRTIEQLDFDPGHYTLQQIATAISWAKNNLITAEQYEPRPGNPLGSIVARFIRRINRGCWHRARRFRRSAVARGDAAKQNPKSAAHSMPVISTSWLMNIRTRIWCNTPWCGRCRSIIPTCP